MSSVMVSVAAPPTAQPPGSTVPGDTGPAPPTSLGQGGEPVTTPPATNATTTTTPLDALPACPVAALADAGEPIEITFWHGLNVDNEDAVDALVDSYNASQDRVVVKGINLRTKHLKPTRINPQGGIITKEAPNYRLE